jgi:hypothetical protein
MLLLAHSITYPDFVIRGSINEKFDSLLSIIMDKKLQKFIVDRYNKNNAFITDYSKSRQDSDTSFLYTDMRDNREVYKREYNPTYSEYDFLPTPRFDYE